MHNYNLTDEQKSLKETARKIAGTGLAPLAAEVDARSGRGATWRRTCR
ncbi:MAG: hypothetical protein AB1742_06310 [bacterium]